MNGIVTSNTEILRQLQTNVAYFEEDARLASGVGDGLDNWVQWNSETPWFGENQVFNG